jgi:hypothetical protein
LNPNVFGAFTLPVNVAVLAKVAFWLASIVTAVTLLLEANIKEPEVSAVILSAVEFVVPADKIDIFFP